MSAVSVRLSFGSWPAHNEGTNCAFADGHVKWVKTASLVGPAYGAPDCLYGNL